jgi:AcrR family transcriptional regulator
MEKSKRQMDIVEAAIHIIAVFGFKEFTMKNLAKAIGVTEAALYRHFNSKHDVIIGILEYFDEVSCEVLDKLKCMDCSSIEKVKEFILNRYELFSNRPDFAKVMFSEELFKNDPEYISYMQNIMHKHKEDVVKYIIHAQQEHLIRDDIDPIDLFRIAVGSMRLIISQWNLSNHAFCLESEGLKLWNTIEKMIKEKP